jgi:peptidoglycan hydrolase CwlO-like protein
MADPRTFVLNPETGKPAVEVTNYQDVEMADLESVLADLDTQIQSKQTEVDNNAAQGVVLTDELTALQDQRDIAKSELDQAQGVVATPAEGVDAGTAPDGGTVETPSENQTEAPAVEAPKDEALF